LDVEIDGVFKGLARRVGSLVGQGKAAGSEDCGGTNRNGSELPGDHRQFNERRSRTLQIAQPNECANQQFQSGEAIGAVLGRDLTQVAGSVFRGEGQISPVEGKFSATDCARAVVMDLIVESICLRKTALSPSKLREANQGVAGHGRAAGCELDAGGA
jgi:hypothetical protein